MAVTAMPTWQALRNQFEGWAAGLRASIRFATGSITGMISGGAASIADRLAGYFAEAIRDTYLDGADGEALTTLANDHWGVARSTGSFAAVTLTFTRAVSAGAGTIPAGTEVTTQADALGRRLSYVTDVDLVFAAELSLTVAATAANIGLAYNVSATTITRQPNALFDVFTVNNVAAAAGGADAQTDEELRAAVRAKPLSYRRGTLAALEYGALTVAGVANAVASEDSTGIVTIYVADGSGSSNSTMTSNVATTMRDYASAGAAWHVVGGSLLTPTITLTVYTRPGYGSELAVPIAASITARLLKLRVGELLYIDMIEQAAMNVSDGIRRVVVSAPASDGQGGAAVLVRAGGITVTVTAESS